MINIWSEVPVVRGKEQVADVPTLVWVLLWVSIAWRLSEFLVRFAEARRTIRGGGEQMIQSGRDLALATRAQSFSGVDSLKRE